MYLASLARKTTNNRGDLMENIFFWLLIFAGAAIALLGLFLVASERELKIKRLELERLSANVDVSSPASIAATLTRTAAIEDLPETSDIQLINEELHNQVSNLSAELELGQKTIMELEGAAQRDRDSQAELQHLRKANEVLISEVVDLKARHESSDGRVEEAMTQQADAIERERQLHNEMGELHDQLEENQQKLRELESSQQNLANMESLAAIGADERRQLEAKIAELEQEIKNARQGVEETNALRATLADSERQREALHAENRSYEQEIRRWQEHSAEGDENRHRLSALRAPFDALLAKYAELAAHHNQFEEDLAVFGGLMAIRASASNENNIFYSGADPAAAMLPGHTATTVHSPMNTAIKGSETGHDEALTLTASLPVEPLAASDGPDTKKKSRMGVFSLVLVVPMAAGLAYGVLNSASQKSENPAPKPVVASVTPAERQPNKSTAVNVSRIVKEETPLRTASIAKAATLTKKQPVAAEGPLPAVKADARVDGIYEVTRTSRVYSAPSEFSQLLGDVEPGLKVNVVNARDGWLEIHSKHGRPPGFIRKEAARAVKN
ncbi:MAG: hypothetical protein QOF64_1443 [Candidatus Binatota bacterium]|nr:hypothetical protein [Candidatus Binatota bacterium]